MPISFTKKDWAKIQEVFDVAVELPVEEQEAVITALCKGIPGQLEHVRSLLHEERNAPNFLEGDVFAIASGPDPKVLRAPRDRLYRQGKAFGDYTLEESLGEGGMGIVYLATQKKGSISRKVAIKFLNKKSSEKAFRSRFIKEQITLSKLNHPNIAQIYDSGIDDEGSLFFSMEYVDGQPIDEFCLSKQLTIKQRLDLVEQICAALIYAHQHLVVHRDLKPTNILMSENLGVKLVDFGNAKNLLETEHTLVADKAFSPLYAAPEQLYSRETTIATDVYQIGVVMYSLLSGIDPYCPESHSFVSLVRAITEEEAHAPSEMIRKLVSVDTEKVERHAKERRLSVTGLISALNGDIDAIIMKCIAILPRDRYASIEALLRDIRAHREQKAVVAMNAGKRYRLQKYIRRNWKSLSTYAATIVAAAGFAAYEYQNARMLEQALYEAKISEEKAVAVSELLVDTFKSADPSVAGLDELTASTLLDNGRQTILGNESLPPEISSYMLSVIGGIYFSQGDYEQSSEILQSATNDKAIDANPSHSVKSLSSLALSNLRLGNYDKAEAIIGRAFGVYENLAASQRQQTILNFAFALFVEGTILSTTGKNDDARKAYEHAVTLFEENNATESREYANTLADLSNLQHIYGEFDQALDGMNKVTEIFKRHIGVNHSQYSQHLTSTAILLADMELYSRAEALAKEALRLQEDIFRKPHPLSSYTMQTLGVLLYRKGSYSESEGVLRRELKISEQHLQNDHFDDANRYLWLGRVLLAQNKFDEAEVFFNDMLQIFKEHTNDSDLLAYGESMLADVEMARGNYEKAYSMYKAAMAKTTADTIRTSIVQIHFSIASLRLGKNDNIKPLIHGALLQRKAYFPNRHSMVAEAELLLAVYLGREGNITEGLNYFQRAISVLENHPSKHRGERRYLTETADTYYSQREY